MQHFLHTHVDQEASIGLALSGGPDSRALFDALLPFRGSHFKELHLLHVDHGWREESRQEGELLREWAKELDLPFHLKRLEGVPKSEVAAREARLSFFREVTAREGLFSLFLAHHRGDQLENGLRRFFQAGRWELVKGMKPVEHFEGLTLMRPFLGLKKEEVASLIRGPYFLDPTNFDPAISERARLRLQLLPEIKRTFGKEIEAPVIQLLADLKELEEFLEPQMAAIDATLVEGPFGSMWQMVAPQALLRLWLRKRFSLSRDQEARALKAALQQEANLHVGPLYLDRGRLFLLREAQGAWRVEAKKGKESGFIACFKGEAAVPEGDLLYLNQLESEARRRVKEGRSKAHVPQALWSSFPLIKRVDNQQFDPALSTKEGFSFSMLFGS